MKENQMEKYQVTLVKFLKDKEKNAGWIRANKPALAKQVDHSKSVKTNPLSAYYDSENFLTTGSGLLVSRNKRGSKAEALDIQNFQKKTGIDPFNPTAEQDDNEILKRSNENLNAYLRTKNGSKVDFKSLPDAAKVIVSSMAYNLGGGQDAVGKQLATGLGGQGVKFSDKLAKAQRSKKASDWASWQDEVVNYHGNEPQAAGVYTRRKEEASLIDHLVRDSQDSLGKAAKPAQIIHTIPMAAPVKNKSSPVETLLNNLNPLQSASAAEPTQDLSGYTNPDRLPEGYQLPDQVGAPERPQVDLSELNEGSTASEDQAARFKAEADENDKPIVESAKAFGNHVVNSFLTENIVGSTYAKARRENVNFDAVKEYNPNFQPTALPDYEDLVKDIPNENLKEILGGSFNEQQFRNRTVGFKEESQIRKEMSDYMSTDPIKGFVGIGVASAVDVTSLIPVTKLARLSGLTKSFKGIPAITRNMGAMIGENVVQDLIQETVLTSNSEIRKWDDGDVLYGMVGGVIMGGVAGKFKTNATVNKFTKLSQRMNAEKNLDGINMMIRSAEKKGLGKATAAELKQVKEVIEQSLKKDHQALVLENLKVRQDVLAKGLKDNKRLEILKEHADRNAEIDKKIEAERANVRAEVDQLKDVSKDVKKAHLQSVSDLQKATKVIEKRLKALKKLPTSPEVSTEINVLTKKFKENNNRIKDGLKRSQTDVKKIRADRARLVRKLDRQGDSYTNETIANLEQSRSSIELELNSKLDEFDKSIDDGTHPELAALIEPMYLNSVARDLGLPEVFNDVDDLDSVLGLKFNDSLSAARVQVQPSEYLKAQDVNELFNKTNPELWNLVSRQFQESRENPALGIASFQVNKDSVSAKIARATRLNKLLTTESVVGRFTLNKSAIKWSNNEFASAFYNWAAPDGVGRLNGGKLSVIETQQMLQSSYGGDMRTASNNALAILKPLILSNKQLRNDLGLPSNDFMARIAMTEVYFPEKVSELLRDEMIEAGNTKLKYGDEVGQAVGSWKNDFDTLTARVLKDGQDAGVVGTEAIEESKGWFHRSWNNDAVVKFDILHGTAKLEELLETGMKEWLQSQSKTLTPELAESITKQAKKFAFGLRSKDTRVFMSADVNYRDFIQKILNADVNNTIDPEVLKKEVGRIEQNLEKNKARELAHRKPIALTASVKLDDGSTFQLRDLLENNILASQNSYMGSMAGRTAAARNGISDVNMLDEWVDRAVELERRRGNLDHADFIERSMREDIETVKYGYAHRDGNIDGALNRLQRMAMKYNAARLMQYTGISSIAEMNTLIAEAGWKAVAEMVTSNVVPLMKSYMFAGISGKVFRDSMYDELSVATGIGFEDISFDALLSSSRMITTSKAGNVVERVVDNAAKMTRRATGHIETTGRRLAVNSLAINYGNIALGRDSVGNILGGVSHVNLVELGLADMINGKAVKNKSWDNIMESIRKNALDEDGKLASESGKNIKQFNLAKWDLATRRKFSEVLVQQANHILVNPDSTTAKLWHNTWWGAVFNQFKTFSNNAQSKVAGHNLNQAMQGYRMGEMAEFSKLAQKYFWGAALGKLSLVLYGSINNAGRDDFSDRMEQYMGVDDFRDWTQALGRSSAITGLDSAIDTAIGLGNLTGHMEVDPLFSSSTIGQSRDRLSWQTTATGQLAVGTAAIGAAAAKGDFDKAGKQALKMSPFRRQLGVNQLLNAMGVD